MSIQDLQTTPMKTIHSEACHRRQGNFGAKRNPASKRRFPIALRMIAASLLLGGFGAVIAGCGSGGSHSGINPNPNPNPNGSSSLLSGSVTDISGNPIVGAAVVFNGQATTSTLEGTYAIPNVLVPAGQTSIVGNVQATKTINGRAWSGQNYLEVLSGEADTSNIHIVMSPSDTQNVLSGTVSDTAGRLLRGARVFVSNGPFTASTGGLFFSNLSAIGTTTDQNGAYTIAHVPPGTTYTVTASFAGFLNQTFSNIAVNAPPAGPTIQPFQLATSSSSPTPSAVNGMSASAFTVPSTPNRVAGASAGAKGFEALKAWFLARRGIKPGHAAAASRVAMKQKRTRSTPAGSIIEVDLFWDYENINNLFGYEVAQATQLNPPNFISIALLRDPQADRFADIDAALTPDTNYYYSVARLDTINFPNGDVNAGVGAPGETVAVNPLGPLSLTGPASGAVSAAKPTFSWTAVNRSNLYQIVVYDRYPDLTGDSSNPQVVKPIWPTGQQSPDTSIVQAPATSQQYQGPALISGHTYYWAVFAQDTVGSAISVSPIQSFIAP